MSVVVRSNLSATYSTRAPGQRFGEVTMSTWWETRTARVSQAAATVSVHAECTVGEAVALLRAHAEATGCDLEEAAGSVLEQRIRFRPHGVALLSQSN